MSQFWTVKGTVKRLGYKNVETPSNIVRKPNYSGTLLVLVECLNPVDERSTIFGFSISCSGIELTISSSSGLTFSPSFTA
eukprot:4383799-Ditylum_brightwellii.AAC.1